MSEPGGWDTKLWRRAKIVFDDLGHIDPEQRHRGLEEACGQDPALLGAVSALLEHERTTTDLLSPPASKEARSAEERKERWLQTRLGPYRLQRVIGQGGAGLVFQAARDDDEFDHQVAVKILLDGLNPDAMSRFRQERQILAELDHPHIARLIDGGSTPDGYPYVVMEYIEGLPVTSFCDQLGATTEERIRFFLQICDAVQYAHRSLVIHRDIKPNNILVTAERRVKLLDFGIAKLLDTHQEKALTEEAEGTWLTPAYASPEQILGAPTTVATDIFSLGILLFEILTGRQLFEGQDKSSEAEGSDGDDMGNRGPRQAQASVPSAAVDIRATENIEDLNGRAAKRGTTPQKLYERLRGELDHIVLKTLRDDPEERYLSVEALSRDLERHLGDLPISVGPQNASYLAWKFFKRHTLAVTVASLLLLATLTFAAFAWRQSTALAAERDATEQQRYAAETVAGNLAKIIRQMEPIRGQRFGPQIQRILDSTALEIDQELGDQPKLQAWLSLAIGEVYREVAAKDQAEPLLQRAVTFHRRNPSDSAQLTRALLALAKLRLRQGKPQEAEVLVREAFESFTDDEDPLLEVALFELLAESLGDQAKFEESLEVLEHLISFSDKIDGIAPFTRARHRNNLALHLKKRGELERAKPLFLEALDLYGEDKESSALNIATVQANLGTLEAAQGDFAKAARRLKESLEIFRALHPDDHPDVSTVRGNLGAVFFMNGNYREAEPFFRQALGDSRRNFGESHPNLATDLNNLGLLLRELNQLEEAESLLREAIEVSHRGEDSDHPDIGTWANNLGLVLLDLGQLQAARRYLEEGYERRRKGLGEDHWEIGNSLTNLANLALISGNPCRAEELARQAAEQLAKTYPDDHRHPAHARNIRGAALAKLGHISQARAMLEESVAVIQSSQNPQSRILRDAASRTRVYSALEPAIPVICPTS